MKLGTRLARVAVRVGMTLIEATRFMDAARIACKVAGTGKWVVMTEGQYVSAAVLFRRIVEMSGERKAGYFAAIQSGLVSPERGS